MIDQPETDTLVGFLTWFEDWYVDNELALANDSAGAFRDIQDFYSSMGFFEPSKEVRESSPGLFGENRLREMMNSLKEKLT